MKYQILVLDLDGTLTNSRKEITPPTLKALIEIQEAGKKVVLASGRPTYGVVPLARQLHLERYGSYILSFNGARITDCRTGQVIYNKTLPQDVIPDIYRIASNYPVDILAYEDGQLLSGFTPTKYSELESRINHLPIVQIDNFCEKVSTFPNNLSSGCLPVLYRICLPDSTFTRTGISACGCTSAFYDAGTLSHQFFPK